MPYNFVPRSPKTLHCINFLPPFSVLACPTRRDVTPPTPPNSKRHDIRPTPPRPSPLAARGPPQPPVSASQRSSGSQRPTSSGVVSSTPARTRPLVSGWIPKLYPTRAQNVLKKIFPFNRLMPKRELQKHSRWLHDGHRRLRSNDKKG